MNTCGMVLLIVYLMVVIGVFIMSALCFSDVRKFRDEKLKEARFKPYPMAERVASWVRLIISAVLPLWNLLILYVYISRTERILEKAKQNLMNRIIEE